MTVIAQPALWPEEFNAAAIALLKASDSAREMDRPDWDFALEIAELRRHALTTTELRSLISLGLICHAAELPSQGEADRTFQSTGRLSFTPRTCFILTPAGRAAAQHLLSNSAHQTATTLPPANSSPILPLPNGSQTPSFSSPGSTLLSLPGSSLVTRHPEAPASLPDLKPLWDADLHRLTFAGKLVKEFKTPAPNQQLILGVFQEEGWPARIDDPLSPSPDLDPKRRLHETITGLNRHQKNRLLRFSGDGTGLGIRWQPFS
jgi:hypothetical protein